MDYPKLISAKALPDYHLELEFGKKHERRIYDFRKNLTHPAFQCLRDESVFNLVQVVDGRIMWPDHSDFSSHSLYEGSVPISVYPALILIQESILSVVPQTEVIYLFGSYAKNTATADSDLDIYVVVADSLPGNPMDKCVDIRLQLFGKLYIPLDLIIQHSAVFRDRKKYPTIENVVANEGRILYAA
ncbi:MAG: DUF2442 domain-containing protein [Oscillospiraceae bacterium]|jgi:predicted nucleotidyltransferase|nr:DUF2442 domain-containing protein [Oscillospiraceae bacterium]